jgi:hypothetical protein
MTSLVETEEQRPYHDHHISAFSAPSAITALVLLPTYIPTPAQDLCMCCCVTRFCSQQDIRSSLSSHYVTSTS